MDARARGEFRLLVIGVGNDYRRDDAVGLIVARRLRARLAGNVTVLEESGEGTALIAAWQGADVVILVDALHSSAAPGTVRRLEASGLAGYEHLFPVSTHAVSVVDAIELARALGALPPRLIIYGIEGENFEVGVGLSPAVEKAARQVEEAVLEEVRRNVPSAPAYGGHSR